MKEKSCSHKDHKGRRLLPVTQFSHHPQTRDGYQSICRACNLRLVIARERRIAAQRRKERNEVHNPLVPYKPKFMPKHDYKDPIRRDVPFEDLLK